MSALPDEPDHFLEWLRTSVDPGVGGDDFLPRSLFGEYLEYLLRQEITLHPKIRFSWLPNDVIGISLDQGQVQLTMRTADTVSAKIVVLATGNYPPSTPPELKDISSRFYAPYAWSRDLIERLPRTGTILVLGTGLTAIDQILSLQAARFEGNIVMLSRHGLLPLVHNTSVPPERSWTYASPDTIRSLFCAVRREVRNSAAKGIPWHTVIDSLRSQTQQIWKSLSSSERKRFLRHVRPYWEIHRHRIPPESYQIVEELLNEGRLKILGGRLLHCIDSGDCVSVTLKERRSSKELRLLVNFIVNCSGYEAGPRMFEDPGIKSLLDTGIAQIDELGLGVDSADNGALIDVLGIASTLLFAIGPIRKGCLWETTAVPEIRAQAVDLADQISTRIDIRMIS